MQPEALLRKGRGKSEEQGFCEEVKNILLAQPLNPLVRLEFEIIPKKNSLVRQEAQAT